MPRCVLVKVVVSITIAAMATKTSGNTSFEWSNVIDDLFLHQIEAHRNQCHAKQQIHCTNDKLDANIIYTLLHFEYLCEIELICITGTLHKILPLTLSPGTEMIWYTLMKKKKLELIIEVFKRHNIFTYIAESNGTNLQKRRTRFREGRLKKINHLSPELYNLYDVHCI